MVDESDDGSSSPAYPSANNTDWIAFNAQYTAATQGNPPTLAEQLGNLPLYAGYWWDDAIGLYHVRHRVYRPEWGRWLQRDPLGYAPGWNLYQYVNGMPWGAVDPMGLWAWVDRIRDWATKMASEAISEDDAVPYVAKHLAAAAGTAAADILDAVEGTGTQMAEDFAMGISPSQRWGMNLADKARKRFDTGESVLESITYTIIDELTANAPIIGGIRRAANSDLWWYERAGGAASAVSDIAGFAAGGLAATGRTASAQQACNSGIRSASPASTLPVRPTITKSAGQLGREGESIASQITGASKNTESWVVNGRKRIPDQVLAQNTVTRNPSLITEVKNVKKLSLTRQLRDYADLVGPDGRVNVALPPGARVSRPLQRAFDDPFNPLNRIDLLPPK